MTCPVSGPSRECTCLDDCEDGWAPHAHDEDCLPECERDMDPDSDRECECEACHGHEAVERDHGSLRDSERTRL